MCEADDSSKTNSNLKSLPNDKTKFDACTSKLILLHYLYRHSKCNFSIKLARNMVLFFSVIHPCQVMTFSMKMIAKKHCLVFIPFPQKTSLSSSFRPLINISISLLKVSPWFSFNQSYFQYVRIGFSHFDARTYCKEQNGGLVSISSEDEQTFLHETFIRSDSEGRCF